MSKKERNHLQKNEAAIDPAVLTCIKLAPKLSSWIANIQHHFLAAAQLQQPLMTTRCARQLPPCSWRASPSSFPSPGLTCSGA